MSKSTRRVLRASLAVAGMAVLCASFVGTASAAPSAPDVPDSVSGDAANGATDGATKAPDSKLSDSKLLHNDVISADIPKIKGASYEASALRVVPARDPGDNEDEDNLCHGTGGTTKLPGDHGKFQHPCQTSGNHIGSEGHLNGLPFAVPASAELPGTDGQGTGDVTQNGDKAAPLTNPGAVAKELTKAPKGDESLGHLDGHHLAVTPA